MGRSLPAGQSCLVSGTPLPASRAYRCRRRLSPPVMPPEAKFRNYVTDRPVAATPTPPPSVLGSRPLILGPATCLSSSPERLRGRRRGAPRGSTPRWAVTVLRPALDGLRGATQESLTQGRYGPRPGAIASEEWRRGRRCTLRSPFSSLSGSSRTSLSRLGPPRPAPPLLDWDV